MKIKLSLSPEDAAIVMKMYKDGEFGDLVENASVSPAEKSDAAQPKQREAAPDTHVKRCEVSEKASEEEKRLLREEVEKALPVGSVHKATIRMIKRRGVVDRELLEGYFPFGGGLMDVIVESSVTGEHIEAIVAPHDDRYISAMNKHYFNKKSPPVKVKVEHYYMPDHRLSIFVTLVDD